MKKLFLILAVLGVLVAIAQPTHTPTPSPAPAQLPAMAAASAPKGEAPRDTSHDKDVVLSKLDFDFEWSSGGFGSVMIANFKLKNNNSFDVKDILVHCTHFGASGTLIDSSTRAVFELFPAGKLKKVRNFNMGFVHSQANSSSCVVAGYSEAA